VPCEFIVEPGCAIEQTMIVDITASVNIFVMESFYLQIMQRSEATAEDI